MSKKQERAELLQQFKEIKIEAGVFQIKNTVNDKIFIGSLPNLKSLNGKFLALQMGTFSNKELQAEYTALGADAFTIEVLEVMKPIDNPFIDMKDELRKCEEDWISKLQPYGGRGYHRLKS